MEDLRGSDDDAPQISDNSSGGEVPSSSEECSGDWEDVEILDAGADEPEAKRQKAEPAPEDLPSLAQLGSSDAGLMQLEVGCCFLIFLSCTQGPV